LSSSQPISTVFTEASDEATQLAHGIKRTQARLTVFEEQFGIRSAEFERRFEADEFDETLDYVDWLMEIRALRLLKEHIV
jgi:hypothetical protein